MMPKYVAKPCVYIITHLPTKRHYVGKSVDVRNRWHAHRRLAANAPSKKDLYITRALRVHGVEEFQFVVAEEFATDADALHAEKWWIEFLRSNVKGYGFNLSSGGENPVRTPQTSEYRRLVSSQSKDRRSDIDGIRHYVFDMLLGELHMTGGRWLLQEKEANLPFIGQCVSKWRSPIRPLSKYDGDLLTHIAGRCGRMEIHHKRAVAEILRSIRAEIESYSVC